MSYHQIQVSNRFANFFKGILNYSLLSRFLLKYPKTTRNIDYWEPGYRSTLKRQYTGIHIANKTYVNYASSGNPAIFHHETSIIEFLSDASILLDFSYQTDSTMRRFRQFLNMVNGIEFKFFRRDWQYYIAVNGVTLECPTYAVLSSAINGFENTWTLGIGSSFGRAISSEPMLVDDSVVLIEYSAVGCLPDSRYAVNAESSDILHALDSDFADILEHNDLTIPEVESLISDLLNPDDITSELTFDLNHYGGYYVKATLYNRGDMLI